mmetsp:Transcript_46235/g.100670  ORF Transcript_46235/g.100670 Transcript_46235/m.100670 type:complete len:231 (+) Transcript_46235:263-955(+)
MGRVSAGPRHAGARWLRPSTLCSGSANKLRSACDDPPQHSSTGARRSSQHSGSGDDLHSGSAGAWGHVAAICVLGLPVDSHVAAFCVLDFAAGSVRGTRLAAVGLLGLSRSGDLCSAGARVATVGVHGRAQHRLCTTCADLFRIGAEFRGTHSDLRSADRRRPYGLCYSGTDHRPYGLCHGGTDHRPYGLHHDDGIRVSSFVRGAATVGSCRVPCAGEMLRDAGRFRDTD